MNEEIIKALVKLDKKDLIKIKNCIEQFEKISNKSKKDNIFIRYLAFRGYKTIHDFEIKTKSTKDCSLGTTLRGTNDNLKSYIDLKNLFNIPDDLFIEYLESRFK